TGIPKPTLRNWREGRIKRPRDWRDVARIARALRLNAAGANRLLQAAEHKPIPDLIASPTPDSEADWELLAP
ncbi:MAG: hypothetical protein GY803_25415, partial [Chloroflexi bacterium]|nr:hypothetical protein [Chloroflexota bacterium]